MKSESKYIECVLSTFILFWSLKYSVRYYCYSCFTDEDVKEQSLTFQETTSLAIAVAVCFTLFYHFPLEDSSFTVKKFENVFGEASPMIILDQSFS